MAEDFDNEFEDEDEEDSSEDSEDKSGAAEEKSKESEDSTATKRIRDLQSKADKAVAEANKLKKQLVEAESKAAKGVNEEDEAEVPASVREWLIAAQERAQTSLMDSDPRFKEYEVDPAFITGDSPAAMRGSAESLTKLIDNVEGKSRNKILIEHGFKPEPASSERNDPVNYATMSREDFAKVQEKALSGGFLRRT